MTLELKNISKNYKLRSREVKVLNNINLTVEDGKFICFIGTSGCGKTTLLNIVAGFEKKTSGEIVLNGKEIKSIGTDRVMMFQESALFPWLKVIDNVEFGMKMSGVNKEDRKERALRYLEMVHLVQFKDAYIHELSGGMRQRVALARALALDSEVLLMDEPFAALDAYTKTVMRSELLKIWEESKKTVLFVTHDVEEAVLLGDTIVVMSSNPGSIKKIIDIPYDRDRRLGEENLNRLVDEIKEDLKLEVQKNA